MKEKNKSGNGFLVQGSILAGAAIIAKVIGMLYRVPLQNILGNQGNGYYSTANEVYAILLMVSCFNMPLAVSRLVSARVHRGEYRNAHRVFLCAVRFAMVLGGAIALVTYVCAGFITKYMMSMELAVYGLRVLAPAIFISAILGTFRGYFQGYGTMVPTAFSQVIEQIVNAIVSLVCANIMYSYGESLAASQGNASLAPAWGAAGATFGTVASITVALILVMLIYLLQAKSLRTRMRKDHTGVRESSADIYRELIVTILPVILSTVVYNITNVLDLGVFSNILQRQGYTEEQATTIWGIYSGQFRVLMNVPLALASSLSPSVVPSLTAAMEKRDKADARRKVSSSIRFTMFLTIPCAVGMAALAEPIITMLFTNETGTPLSVGIMQVGSLMIIFYALSTLSTGILQGLGRMRQPLIHCCIALVIHLAALYILLTTFRLNIYSVVIANIIFALIICVMNAVSIARFLNYRQEIYRTFVVPAVVSVIMAAAAYLVYMAVHTFLGNTVSTFIAVIAGVLVYGIGMVSFHGVTQEEIASLPKGTVLIRILRKMGLLR
ncbi:MAG: polysaccharide biosynthesis protein [Lachnospiraceae bacterium]|nr:polysaccharide biosynthesis protein [Lachnospiraceae bacterium]